MFELTTLANVGLPMIFLQMPALAIALVPTIALEAIVARTRHKLTLNPLVGGVALANAVSTFVGIPVAWVILVVLEIFTGGGVYGFDSPLAAFRSTVMQAPWLVPHEGEAFWLIPTASLVLLAPYFVASVCVEWLVLRWAWKSEPQDRLLTTVWRVNLASYAALLIVNLIWLWRNLQPYLQD